MLAVRPPPRLQDVALGGLGGQAGGRPDRAYVDDDAGVSAIVA